MEDESFNFDRNPGLIDSEKPCRNTTNEWIQKGCNHRVKVDFRHMVARYKRVLSGLSDKNFHNYSCKVQSLKELSIEISKSIQN